MTSMSCCEAALQKAATLVTMPGPTLSAMASMSYAHMIVYSSCICVHLNWLHVS